MPAYLTPKEARAAGIDVPARSKYHNQKTEYAGHIFHSKAEAQRYMWLKAEQEAGRIHDLTCQPRFKLQDAFRHNGKTVQAIFYIADFMYIRDNRYVVEDVKGTRTTEYKIKHKLFLAKYRDKYEFVEIKT